MFKDPKQTDIALKHKYKSKQMSANQSYGSKFIRMEKHTVSQNHSLKTHKVNTQTHASSYTKINKTKQERLWPE